MSITNSADFSSFKTRLTPPALACFRVLFENVREMLAKQGPQQSYEVPLANFISLDEVADVESVAESIQGNHPVQGSAEGWRVYVLLPVLCLGEHRERGNPLPRTPRA